MHAKPKPEINVHTQIIIKYDDKLRDEFPCTKNYLWEPYFHFMASYPSLFLLIISIIFVVATRQVYKVICQDNLDA